MLRRLILLLLRLNISAPLLLFFLILSHLLLLPPANIFIVLKFAYSAVEPPRVKVFEKQYILLVDALLQLSILACVDQTRQVKHLYHLVANIFKVLKILNVFYQSFLVLSLSYQLK